MLLGVGFALLAGLVWGLVFITPLLLPQYPALLLSVGRYLAFGLIALPLAWFDRAHLSKLTKRDWLEAGRLALIGNLLYYAFLAAAIQRAGAPLPTMIIGTLPVVIAVCANLFMGQGERLAWRRLFMPLLLIGAGIACVNHAEWALMAAPSATVAAPGHAASSAIPAPDASAYVQGALLALGALMCWTIYPLRNARWLRQHADRNPRGWATAQGLATLPLALLGYALLWAWFAFTGSSHKGMHFEMPLGPTPLNFVLLMFAVGLLASWVGTLCWNEASQRLPAALSGQLIVFETLAALAYALMLRGERPALLTMLGAALLVAGVLWALRPARAPALQGAT